MTKLLEVSLSLPLDDEHDVDDIKTIISEAVVEAEHDFLPIIGAVCAKYNDRANYCSESLGVESVDLEQPVLYSLGQLTATGTIQVEYEWTAYYGCDDMNMHDVVQDVWEFEAVGNRLNFCLTLPEQRVDEF